MCESHDYPSLPFWACAEHIIGSRIQTWNHSTLFIRMRWMRKRLLSYQQRSANSLQAFTRTTGNEYLMSNHAVEVGWSPCLVCRVFTRRESLSFRCKDIRLHLSVYDIRLHLSVYDVRLHLKSKIHEKNTKAAFHHTPSTDFFKPKAETPDSTTSTEVMFAYFVAEHNLPTAIADYLSMTCSLTHGSTLIAGMSSSTILLPSFRLV